MLTIILEKGDQEIISVPREIRLYITTVVGFLELFSRDSNDKVDGCANKQRKPISNCFLIMGHCRGNSAAILVKAVLNYD